MAPFNIVSAIPPKGRLVMHDTNGMMIASMYHRET